MPTTAIIAVTLNCNSRCVMCDIWKNRIRGELAPQEYLTLPPSLTDINITGGEPFLRRDIADIVSCMKHAAPKARLLVNTNGFMTEKIVRDMTAIRKIDPTFGFRVSIDGMDAAHDAIRRIPGGFAKAVSTLRRVRDLGFADTGISFTLMDKNVRQLPLVQEFAQTNGFEFSLTVATDSAIYFGSDKHKLRGNRSGALASALDAARRRHYRSFRPKDVMRGWFVGGLADFVRTGVRPLPCDAGAGFFYLDSVGNVYACHIRPWLLGNIRTTPIADILREPRYRGDVASCNGCWMVCTAKSAMAKRLPAVAGQALCSAAAAVLTHRTTL
jgi:MoaA/NifB/PqqE/SkfB family radical SAM enzyme